MTLEEALVAYDEVYRIEIEGEYFYVRPLGRKEFQILLESSVDGFEFEDSVCYLCTVSPEGFDFSNGKAGIPAMLCLRILNISGLGNDAKTQELLTYSRQVMNSNLEMQMDTVILVAFPQYKLEDIENWTRIKFLSMYARAEWVLRELRGVNLQIADPNAQPAPQ